MGLGPEPFVRLEDVRFAYPGGPPVLRGVDLALGPGERVALMGANGSGKTTLARLVAGLLEPTAGTVRVGAHDPARAPRPRLAPWVGLVFQNPDHQLFAHTVWEEVAFGPRIGGMEGDALDRRVEADLARFDLASHGADLPFALSGGERKRVTFAAAHALRPRVLFLDEPTKGMDAGRKRALAAFAQEEAKEGRTVVFVTHDPEFALEATARCVVLHEGRVFRDGPTPEVLGDPGIEEAGLALPSPARLARLLERRGVADPRASVEGLLRWLEGGA